MIICKVKQMKQTFGQALLAARKQKGLSQQEFADLIPVNRSSVANWEADRRLPNATIIAKIAEIFDVDVTELLDAANDIDNHPNVIIVDDNKIILAGGTPIIEQALPNANVIGFTKPSEAMKYAKDNRVALAFLDIELGITNGLDICNSLLEINPRTNVIFLTAYPEYSIKAWNTEASGFMVKPITLEGVKEQLKKLRHPFPTGAIN
ncbi:MAG: response regulator [Erysipelotrichaceae bacterium]|nr:response regulator [Erysipelotrichaceae bacterium]